MKWTRVPADLEPHWKRADEICALFKLSSQRTQLNRTSAAEDAALIVVVMNLCAMRLLAFADPKKGFGRH